MALVLITGASSGIGAAAARRFAARGDRVVLVARSAEALKSLADEIGGTAIAFPADAADPAQVATLAGEVLAQFGAPDILVHSAGAGQWKTLPDTTPAEARAMMDAPYFAAFNVTHAFLPAMLERGRGVILTINSPAGFVAWPSSVGYAAARAALRGFHEALAHDLAGTGVAASHVVFGRVASGYWDNNPNSAERMPALARIAPEMTPDHCAAVLTQLARRPRHTAIFPWQVRVLVALSQLFPAVARRLIRF